MKKVFFLLIAISSVIGANAQHIEKTRRWFLGVNYKLGALEEKIYLRSVGLIYPSVASFYQSDVKVTNDRPTAFDVQLGYYFSPNNKWGISTGIVYSHNTGTLTQDSLHVEYKSVDGNGDVFRQAISSVGKMKETVENTNISVPLLLKCRTKISKRINFIMDAGIVYNVKMETTYSSDASFDYEAIYKFQKVNGEYVAVYDGAKVPGSSDWLITKKEYRENNNDGQEVAYFQSLRDQGYLVALDQKTKATGNSMKHKSNNIGLLLQPSFAFRLSNTFSFNLGLYYMYQNFKTTDDQQKIMRTDKIGEYNTMLNNVNSRRQNNYGLNLGVIMNL